MSLDFNKERIRTSIIIGLASLLILYIVLSERMFFEAKVYGAFGLLTLVGLFIFNWFWKKSKRKESLSNAYFGINTHWIRGIGIGALASVVFILLTRIRIFSSVSTLITPSLALSSVGATFIVIFFLAPIFEEVGTTGTLLSFFNLYIPFWASAILKGLIFAILHWYAYVVLSGAGSLVYALGALTGAFVFGIMTSYLAKYQGLESSFIAHAIFNGFSFLTAYQLLTIAP